jgi:hypothetical protein
MIGNHKSKTVPFAIGGTQNDTSDSLRLDNTGTLRVQHCVDSRGQITESDESIADNCEISEFTISSAALAPSATIVAGDCSISNGQNSCQSLVKWNSSNVISASVRQEGTEFSTADANTFTGANRTVNYGSDTFTFYDGATQLAFNDAHATCVAGTAWNATTELCDSTLVPVIPAITVTATPKIIRSGQTAEIKVDVVSLTAFTCTVLNAKSTPETFDETTLTFTVTTRPLYAKQVVTVECTDVNGLKSSGEAIVEIIPRVQEI